MKTSCRIKNNNTHALLLRMLYCCFCDIYRFMLVTHGKHFHALLLTIDLQLFDRCGAVHITGGQQYLAAFDLKLSGQLCCSSRLTCSLKTGHHDNRNLIGWPKLNLCRLAAHQFDHLFIYNLNDGLSRCQALQYIRTDCSFLHRFDELLYYFETYIRFQKCKFDFFQTCFYIGLGQSSFTPKVLKYVL